MITSRATKAAISTTTMSPEAILNIQLNTGFCIDIKKILVGFNSNKFILNIALELGNYTAIEASIDADANVNYGDGALLYCWSCL